MKTKTIPARDKRLIVFFLSCLILALSGFGQKNFNMEEKKMLENYKFANAIFLKGKDLYAKEKFDQAEAKFKECLEKMPQFADASYFLALILSKRNELEAALQSIEKANTDFTTIAQFYTYSHQQRLEMLEEQRKIVEEKIRGFQEQGSQVPKSDSTGKAATVASSTTKLQAELNQINLLLKDIIPPTMSFPAEYSYLHGNILFKMKRYADAAVQYVETIKLNPKHEFAYNNLINIYFMQRNLTEAIKLLKEAENNNVTVNPKLKEAVEKAVAN